MTKLPGSENMTQEQREALCDEFIAKAIQWCKRAGVPIETIESQLLATAVASVAMRLGADAAREWLESAALKVRVAGKPAGNA